MSSRFLSNGSVSRVTGPQWTTGMRQKYMPPAPAVIDEETDDDNDDENEEGQEDKEDAMSMIAENVINSMKRQLEKFVAKPTDDDDDDDNNSVSDDRSHSNKAFQEFKAKLKSRFYSSSLC